MAEILVRKGSIKLDRIDLDGAHVQFDDIPDRNILVAESGQTYALNETQEGASGKRDFSVWPVEIQITGRSVGYDSHPDGYMFDRTLRVRVTFQQHGEDFDYPNLGLLFFSRSGNEGRLEYLDRYENLTYKVRPRIEDVEEYGE
jgi:hypothetical protein